MLLAQNANSQDQGDVSKQLFEMRATIQRLQRRVDDLEAKLGSPVKPANPQIATAVEPALPPAEQTSPSQPAISNFLRGTSVNVVLDAYYDYNFNDPIGRVSRLRAYDVVSNAFGLNQATVIFQNAPDLERGKRWGLRLDLQFGQATETLQGNAANELRPEIYRQVFQAYGTYILPLGTGLKLDFGKFASSLGIEGNYTKDQMNYSRSYWFNFLPFYHMGARVTYQLTKQVALNYWVTNGTQQTEPFNNFKDQFVGLEIRPNQNLSWNVNYYFGQEHPDLMILPNATDPNLPNVQGVPFIPIVHSPKGKLHIIDSYATWQATPKWTFAIEGDCVIQRLFENAPPDRTWGGAGYARYQLSPRLAIAARAEYLADQGRYFSGINQALKETTLTIEQRVAEGFLVRQEWRMDFSNQPYFYTSQLGILKRQQNTAGIGVIWWIGPKKSPW
jgi:hypothetical protein